MSESIKEWFPLYAADWITSIGLRLCSPFARGILIDLMAYSWHNETPGIIKENPADLSLFFHCSEDDFMEAIEELEKRGRVVRENGNITIARLVKVAQEQRSKYRRRAEAGRAGGLAKAQKRKLKNQDSSNATANSSNALAIDKKRREESRKEQKRFTPPTPEEVTAYAKERGKAIDGDRFVDFYVSKGWMVGKNKMKDWKAAVRNWTRAEKPTAPKSSGPVFTKADIK